MTNEEALQFFKDDMPLRVSGYELKCDAYEAAIEALEKQIPKKPFPCIYEGHHGNVCPECQEDVWRHNKFCYNCGQRLLWEDKE